MNQKDLNKIFIIFHIIKKLCFHGLHKKISALWVNHFVINILSDNIKLNVNTT